MPARAAPQAPLTPALSRREREQDASLLQDLAA